MSIIQISKIQQRSGNLVDLPQLDEAEFGWATDSKRLFIGKTTPNENVEVLTSYSEISFSQLTGGVGNLNINPVTLENGQVLAFDGTNWVNKGRNADGLLTLGDVGNVKIDGGAIGYVLETDGLGNLAWTPKGFLYTEIEDLTPDSGNTFGYGANAVVMTVPNTTPYFNLAQITISGVEGNSNSNVNSEIFYIRLSDDYPTSGNVVLFTDTDANSVFIDGDITYTNDPNSLAVATSAALGTGGGGGGGAAFPPISSVQYNSGGLLKGDSQFTFNESTNSLNVGGNVDANNFNATNQVLASRFVSNVATGTSPLQVDSTTRVANLNVAQAGFADEISVTEVSSGNVFYPLLTDSLTGNASLNANSQIVFDVANGELTSNTLQSTGDITVGGDAFLLGEANVTGNLNVTEDAVITGNLTASNIDGGNLVSANFFQGDGSLLTNLSVGAGSTIENGNSVVTVDEDSDVRFTVSGTANVLTVASNSATLLGDMTASSFSGDGANLSALNASNLSTGTVPSARLSGSYDITANSATQLETGRTINGTSFDGTQNITTLAWGTTRSITIGNTSRNVNGSADYTWSLADIGAAPAGSYLTAVNLGRTEGATSVTITNTGGSDVTIRDATTSRAGLVTTGDQTWNGTKTAINFVATSDEKLKDNIESLDADECLEKILALRPTSYNWKESGEYDTGLIAQEVKEVLPHKVHTTEEGTLALAYSKIVSELIGAVQSQNKTINSLKEEIKELKGKL